MRRNRMVSVILVFMMVFSAMFGSMTVFSFAEGEQSDQPSETAADTIGPALQDYTIEIRNADPKTEGDQAFKVTLIFNETLTTDRWTKNAFNIYLNDTLLAQTKYQLNDVTAEGNKLILDIIGNNDDFVAIYRGVLKISLRSNYYEDIMDESGNGCSFWTDIKTLIPVGLAFEQDASKTVTGDADTPASVTFKVTGDALLRGMSPIEITVGGESPVTSADSTVAVHTHNFIDGTNENWASNLASNFNRISTGKYTMTASGDTVTLTATSNGADEALTNSTVIRPYAFTNGDEATGVVNDAVVQPSLLALTIQQAEERLAAIDPSLVTDSAKKQLEEALTEAKIVAEKDVLAIVSPIEWNEARNKLEAALEAASDNAITTDSARRHNGSVTLNLHGGNEWIETINGVSVDGKALTADQFTVNAEKKTITLKSGVLDTEGQITPRLKNYSFSVASSSFATVEKTVRIEYRGSDTFQVRYIDEDGNILASNTYSEEEMIAMSSEESEWYTSSCTVMGPDVFLAKGVHVQDLLNKLLASEGAQNITFNPDTTVIKIRTNDSLRYDADADPETVVNDSTTQNGYFNTISYNDLMRDRYYFPGLYNGSGIGDSYLQSKRFATTEREDVGSDPDKALCEPMIAWEYVERAYGDNQVQPTEDDYDENITADMGFRFLLGSPIKISPNGKPMVDDNYWTQFLVAFQCFGIDFVCESAKVTFNTTPEDATVEVKDISGKVLTPNEDGTFSAPQTPSQPYTYTVSKDGYTEQTGTFTVNEKAVASGVTLDVSLEEKESYNVTLNQSEGGTISTDKTTAKEGETVTLTVTPDADHSLDTVTVKDSSGNDLAVTKTDNSYSFTMPEDNVTVGATFSFIPVFTVNVPETINGGTATTDKTTAKEGETVTLTLTPDINHYLDSVSVTSADGTEVELTSSSEEIFTFVMPKADVTVEIAFETEYIDPAPTPIKTYNINVSSAEGGNVATDKEKAKAGEAVTLTLTPQENYSVKGVTVTASDGSKPEISTSENGKYTFAMPASDVNVTAEFAATTPDDQETNCPSLNFNDLDTSKWYHEAVDFVLNKGFMRGTGSKTFEPDTNMTRAMLVQILYNLEGTPSISGNSVFTDVSTGSWYFNAVKWAADNQIVNGIGNNLFAPDVSVTREQTATILYRYFQFKGIAVDQKGNLSTFKDGTSVSSWAADAMIWAVGAGVIKGVSSTELQPQGTTTRAQMAQILLNISDFLNLS